MDNTLSAGVKQAGDVSFIKLELIDTKNKNVRYNLLGSFIDFTIYEDLFSPVLSGYVALVETQNLIESIPIIGEEIIYAEFQTPSLKSVKCTFYVTKVGIKEHQDKKSAYTLELISREGYIDLNNKYSTAYSGNTSDLIASVFSSSFNSDIVDLEQSDNKIKFVSPYWNPLKIINHIVSRALYPNNKMITPNYLFYQTTVGHKFKSLTSLFNQKPFLEYFFDNNPARARLTDGTSTRDIDREYKTIKELTFVSSQDHIKNMLAGAYNHRVFGMNVLRKKMDVKTYAISDNFNKTSHIDAFMLSTGSANKTSGMTSIQHVYPNLFDGINDISDEIVAKRISLLAQLETYKIDIVVHGRTDIEVGKILNIWINQFKTIDESDKYKSDGYDKIYSGRYLVTAVSHRFTQARHEINMQCIKDSAFSEIKIK